jgi:hypothetical protein
VYTELDGGAAHSIHSLPTHQPSSFQLIFALARASSSTPILVRAAFHHHHQPQTTNNSLIAL